MISLDTVVAKCDGLLWRNYDGEVLIIREENSDIYMLNSVASHIWKIVDGRSSLEDIVISVCDHFDVDRTTAIRDVVAFVSDLVDKNLLKIV